MCTLIDPTVDGICTVMLKFHEFIMFYCSTFTGASQIYPDIWYNFLLMAIQVGVQIRISSDTFGYHELACNSLKLSSFKKLRR